MYKKNKFYFTLYLLMLMNLSYQLEIFNKLIFKYFRFHELFISC